jgi:hypothetical protein
MRDDDYFGLDDDLRKEAGELRRRLAQRTTTTEEAERIRARQAALLTEQMKRNDERQDD